MKKFLIIGLMIVALLTIVFSLTIPFAILGAIGRGGAIDKATGAAAAITGGQTYTGVQATAYVPDWKEKEDGKNCDPTGGSSVDTKGNKLQVLPDYIAKKAPFVSIAIDKTIYSQYPYGTTARIPELEKMFNNGASIEFRLVDTFAESKQGAGYTHVDIAVDCAMLSNWKNPQVTLVIGSGSSSLASSSGGTNGVPLFLQTDPRWANVTYGIPGHTIGEAGCCPTAAAMVLKFYGADVDPPTIAKFSYDHGDYHGNGTEHGKLIPQLAQEYHLAHGDSLGTSASSWSKALNLLQQHHPLIAAGTGRAPYSSAGHCIVLTGYDSSTGLVSVNNPSARLGNGPFPLSEIEQAHALYYLGQ